MKVLVTAGASGIGRAMADGFAAKGADIVVLDVDAAALENCPNDWDRHSVDVTNEVALAQALAGQWFAPMPGLRDLPQR